MVGLLGVGGVLLAWSNRLREDVHYAKRCLGTGDTNSKSDQIGRIFSSAAPSCL